MSQAEEDWPTKYPWRLPPRGDTHPYVPPKRGHWVRNAWRGLGGGYRDRDDNEWVPHYPASGREEDLHWDVQHPNGTHTNVRPDGELPHGDDHF
jgi:hypothetical protein